MSITDLIFRKNQHISDNAVLRNLVIALGQDPGFLNYQPERYWSCEYSGKVKIQPVEKGFQVSLEVYSQLFHQSSWGLKKAPLKKVTSFKGIVPYPSE